MLFRVGLRWVVGEDGVISRGSIYREFEVMVGCPNREEKVGNTRFLMSFFVSMAILPDPAERKKKPAAVPTVQWGRKSREQSTAEGKFFPEGPSGPLTTGVRISKPIKNRHESKIPPSPEARSARDCARRAWRQTRLCSHRANISDAQFRSSTQIFKCDEPRLGQTFGGWSDMVRTC